MASTNPPAIKIPSPERGDVWLVAFGAGHKGEPAKTRPAVIASEHIPGPPSIFDLAIVLPTSSTLSPELARPTLHPNSRNGLKEESVVVVRAMRGVSPDRLVKKLGTVDSETMTMIDMVLRTFLRL